MSVQGRLLGRVLVVVSAVVMLDVLFYSAISPLLPTYVERLHLSTTEAGVLSGSYALGTLVASLPAGWLAGRYGPRPLLLLGLGGLGAASIVFGLADDFRVLTAARFAQGAAGAAAWAAGLAWLVDSAPRDRRGQVIGVALGTGIAGAIGGPVLGALAVAFGPSRVFPGVAVVAAALAVAVARSAGAGREPADGDVLPALRRAVRDRRVAAGAWLTALPALFFGTFGVLVPLALSGLGASSALIAGAFLAAAAVEAAMSPLVGRLSDRRGRLLPLRWGLAGILGAAVLLPLPRTTWLLVLAVVAAGTVTGILFAPASALLSDGAEAAGLPQGVVFGLFNLAWAGGQVAGAAGGARLADATGDAVPYTVVAVLAAASLAALLLRRGGTVSPR